MKRVVSRESPKGENGDAQVAKGIRGRQYSVYMKTPREKEGKGFSPLPHQQTRWCFWGKPDRGGCLLHTNEFHCGNRET